MEEGDPDLERGKRGVTGRGRLRTILSMRRTKRTFQGAIASVRPYAIFMKHSRVSNVTLKRFLLLLWLLGRNRRVSPAEMCGESPTMHEPADPPQTHGDAVSASSWREGGGGGGERVSVGNASSRYSEAASEADSSCRTNLFPLFFGKGKLFSVEVKDVMRSLSLYRSFKTTHSCFTNCDQNSIATLDETNVQDAFFFSWKTAFW